MNKSASIVVLVLVSLGLGAPAFAEEAPEEPEAYESPMRATWQDEVRKDAVLRADMKDFIRTQVHEEESSKFTRNNRHVLMAYAAIWVLTMGFVLFMWRRQSSLQAEIARLSSELARAAKDGGA